MRRLRIEVNNWMLLENKGAVGLAGPREPRRSINRIIFVENESAHVKQKLLTRVTYGPRNLTWRCLLSMASVPVDWKIYYTALCLHINQ